MEDLWIPKGLTTYYSFTQKGVFRSFEELQRCNGLEKDDFYRYLQVRTYFNQNLREKWETAGPGFFNVFLNLIKSDSCTKLISRLYNSILASEHSDTEYIRNRWVKEGNLSITSEGWERINKLHWITSSSNTWREFCWKNTSHYFFTPAQKKHQGKGDTCWRLCGTSGANHFHIFWDCPVIKIYWEQLCDHLNNIFMEKFQCKCETLYLGDVPCDNWSLKDKKLLLILLAASKKTITRKWLKPEAPTIEDWIKVVQDIYILEKLSFSIKGQRETFFRIWSKWTNYVKPVFPVE